jgi:hypothetical protein
VCRSWHNYITGDRQYIAAEQLGNPIHRSGQPSNKHGYHASKDWALESYRAGCLERLSRKRKLRNISNDNNHQDKLIITDLNSQAWSF